MSPDDFVGKVYRRTPSDLHFLVLKAQVVGVVHGVGHLVGKTLYYKLQVLFGNGTALWIYPTSLDEIVPVDSKHETQG